MSEIQPGAVTAPNTDSLVNLGWRPFFQQQLDIDELDSTILVRVVAVHRSRLEAIGPSVELALPTPNYSTEDDVITIGDWLVLDAGNNRVLRRLDRLSVFKRRAPGTARAIQLIAANVDTLMIVSSCNQDFNIARIERYLALAKEAEVTPVVVLTKADQSPEPEIYRQKAQNLMPNLCIELLNATDPAQVKALENWCRAGQTIAFVGSSGTGKSTLANSLLGRTDIATQDIREDDAKGRHTTTHRALYQLPSGGWVLDTPGIRELQLTDVAEGLAEVFGDIETLAANCRFHDCQHQSEPGCSVVAAIQNGDLDQSRLERWRKLVSENERNSRGIAETRAKDRALGKKYREALREKHGRK
jgi:ribosome biogenesis GTPase